MDVAAMSTTRNATLNVRTATEDLLNGQVVNETKDSTGRKLTNVNKVFSSQK